MMSAIEHAWAVLKSDTVIPVGIYNGRKVAMLHGKPYYTSKAESYSDGMGYKNKGQWYPFGGIEPDFSQWDARKRGEWWIKGNHPDIPRHARMSSFEPSLQHQVLSNRLGDYEDWDEISSGQELNQRLSELGFEPNIRGSWE